MQTTTLRVATGQAPVAEGEVRANAGTAAALTQQAAAQGARLLLLPEAFLTGYSQAAFAAALPTAETLPELLAPLLVAVQETGVLVLVSSPVQQADRKTLSTLLVSGDQVNVVYDKQHLVGYELDHFTPGESGTIVEVDGWRLGLSICYDASFPEHARAAAESGAHVYMNSNAFFPGGSQRQEIYCQARALDNGMYTVSAGYTGTTAGVEFVGGSAIHDPEGRRIARLGTETGVLVADLSATEIVATRAAHTMGVDRRSSLGSPRFLQA